MGVSQVVKFLLDTLDLVAPGIGSLFAVQQPSNNKITVTITAPTHNADGTVMTSGDLTHAQSIVFQGTELDADQWAQDFDGARAANIGQYFVTPQAPGEVTDVEVQISQPGRPYVVLTRWSDDALPPA